MERTLAIIKPDAVQRQLVGVIISEIEMNQFAIRAIRTLRLTRDQAALFYQQHCEKPFYESLVGYISSGQLYALVLERESAVEEWRKLMGPTNPVKTGPLTLRRRFALDIQRNSVHGADTATTAEREIDFFFGEGV
ncbi:MAG: nucleoside-diphosphate kinase [Acidobacteria bacterium]|jgi:nucleoside-diphosphate kinase|nr:nucleoside-diphosphate kinase [Acidobacteriota bacterium]